MTFLNPFVLFGLAAAAIPVILHLLNIRKLRTIEFSTLAFLKELQKSTMRRIKIRQWLLLLLRTVLIILLVIAFSRPALKGTFTGTGSHAKTTMAIIFDDTYSMGLQNEKGSFIKQARTAAARLVNLMEEGDEAFFMRLSDIPGGIAEVPTQDTKKLYDVIQTTDVSFKHRDLERALRIVSRLLQQSKNINKEIYLITDGQVSAFPSPSSSRDNSVERLFDSHVNIFSILLSEKGFENVGIESVSIPPSLLQKGKPFLVRPTIKNYGSMRAENHLVSVFLDGKRVMQKSVTLAPGSAQQTDFLVTPQHSGFNSGYVELEDDQLEADNRWYFSIYIPDQIDVLALSTGSNLKYIKLAFELNAGEQAAIPVVLHAIDPSQLSSDRLRQADVVVLSGIGTVTQSQALLLSEFLAEGKGGVIFFPAADLNRENYNSILMPALHLPSIAGIDTVSAVNPSQIEKIDRDHPLFRGMFDIDTRRGEQKTLESPAVKYALRFSSESSLRPLLVLGNGRSFLWEKKSQYGTIIGFAVPPTPEWSDVPFKGIFVPLLYQSVLYLSSSLSNPEKVVNIAGTPIDLSTSMVKKHSTSSSIGSKKMQIIDPRARSTSLQAEAGSIRTTGTASHVLFDEATLPGIYTVRRGNDTLALVPVNMDRAESEGARIDADALAASLKHLGFTVQQISRIGNIESIDTAVLQSRFGIELWKYFLIAAICVAVIEMIVARESKKELSSD